MEEKKYEGSKCIGHEPCPKCGSRDNLGVYDDGHKICYSASCDYRVPAPFESGYSLFIKDNPSYEGKPLLKVVSSTPSKPLDLIDGSYSRIKNRNLSEETCRFYGYQTGEYKGQPCHIANFFDASRNKVAQKVRLQGKKFVTLGNGKAKGFFGQHLWQSGKYLTITEGEIDALSVAQVFECKWPVVSLPDGAQSAERVVKDHYEWLDGFDTIVLMFDQDDAGRAAAATMAEMLPAGKVKIASLPLKDANECLKQGMHDAIRKAFWDARQYRPDGIVMASDLRELVRTDDRQSGVDYPWDCVTRITRGIRPSELVTITAGSGIGKTTFVREIAYSLHQEGHQVGLLMLEEANRRTLEGIVGLHMDKNILIDRSGVTQEQIVSAFDDLFKAHDIILYDHFGSTDVDNICNRIRYMAKVCGCKYIFLDHISILVSGLATTDERKLIDITMTKLRTLVQETGISLFVVSHLKRPTGDKGHEDGAEVHLGQLRGSHAIAQLSDIVLGLQKPEGGTEGAEIKVLKNRFTGEVGTAGQLYYSRDTGRLLESSF